MPVRALFPSTSQQSQKLGPQENYKWKEITSQKVEGIAAVGWTSQRKSHAKMLAPPENSLRNWQGSLKIIKQQNNKYHKQTTNTHPPTPNCGLNSCLTKFSPDTLTISNINLVRDDTCCNSKQSWLLVCAQQNLQVFGLVRYSASY